MKAPQLPKTQLSIGEPLLHGIRRASNTLLQEASHRIHEKERDQGDDLHWIRTSIKRLRTYLCLARHSLGEHDFRKADEKLRQLDHELAGLRDHARTDEPRRKRRALKPVSRGIDNPKRKQGHAKADFAFASMARAITRARESLNAILVGEDDWPAVDFELRKTFRQCVKLRKTALHNGRKRDFRRWGAQLRRLHNELSFLERIWPGGLQPELAKLQSARDLIAHRKELALLRYAIRKSSGAHKYSIAKHLFKSQIRRRSADFGNVVKPKPSAFLREFARHRRAPELE